MMRQRGLLATQRAFRDFLVTPADGVDAPADCAPERGLRVYHHAYRARLRDALRSAYDKTWAWLGDDAFLAAANRHIAPRTPKSWTLDAYGADFQDTLRGLYPDDPEVAELAALEWALHTAFAGPDAEPVSAEALSGIDWDRARLTVIPTARMLPVTTNVAAIWSAIAAGTDVPAAERLHAAAAILVWRQDMSPKFRTIDVAEMLMFELARKGMPFGEICARLVDACDDPAAAAGTILGNWLRGGVLAAAC